MTVVRRLRLVANRFGIDLSRYREGHSTGELRAKLIASRDVDLVLDIGAARGEYVKSLREFGYRGRAVSFEPLPGSFESLVRASRRDPDWTVLNVAVGDRETTVDFHVSGNSDSSSVLPMLGSQVSADPESRYVDTIKVKQMTVDNVLAESPEGHCFLKIDVQGYESSVLAGARKSLDRIVGMEIELTFIELYEGQTLFREMVDFISDSGFELQRLTPGFFDPATGRMLEADGIFLRAGQAGSESPPGSTAPEG